MSMYSDTNDLLADALAAARDARESYNKNFTDGVNGLGSSIAQLVAALGGEDGKASSTTEYVSPSGDAQGSSTTTLSVDRSPLMEDGPYSDALAQALERNALQDGLSGPFGALSGTVSTGSLGDALAGISATDKLGILDAANLEKALAEEEEEEAASNVPYIFRRS